MYKCAHDGFIAAIELDAMFAFFLKHLELNEYLKIIIYPLCCLRPKATLVGTKI